MKFINKKKFAKAVLVKNSDMFIVYIALLKVPLEATAMIIYLSQASMISALK